MHVGGPGPSCRVTPYYNVDRAYPPIGHALRPPNPAVLVTVPLARSQQTDYQTENRFRPITFFVVLFWMGHSCHLLSWYRDAEVVLGSPVQHDGYKQWLSSGPRVGYIHTLHSFTVSWRQAAERMPGTTFTYPCTFVQYIQTILNIVGEYEVYFREIRQITTTRHDFLTYKTRASGLIYLHSCVIFDDKARRSHSLGWR